MIDGQFMNKVAIVTGASSGIGEATAALLASQGASVVLASRRENLLKRVASNIKSIGGSVAYFAGDVGDEKYVEQLVAFSVQRFGKIDIAVNNAGTTGKLGEIGELGLEDWQHTIRTNLTSAFLCAKYQTPFLLETGGNMIFTSSFVGHTAGFPGMSAYGASKAGITGLVKCLAAELGELGIRVNALLPGGTDTEMAKEAAGTDEQMEHVKSIHALKRLSQPDEIAQAICFLASDSASFVTGISMLADGGVSISRT